MSPFPKSDARVKAAVAAVAAVAVLVTLVLWRPAGLLSVALALLCVLLGVIAGVTASAARQAADEAPAPSWPTPPAYDLDAETLGGLDPRAVRDARGAGLPGLDADTLEALDPREIRQSRQVNGLSDR
ncbi:hypothetical protein [Micromonospora auratinigra]|uniref:Uncharacterized protein n=1 Tax=Micromonospora auratinigra TaxID=261654 RepID=A0A1A8ZZ36_9ACTN|nr:hypothetical protein [Micromonospora auratinigra]SBT49101.1 hypothetical protein GA0070611_4290 [Micromonospora auratinigra]